MRSHPVLADRRAARGAALGAPGGGWPSHHGGECCRPCRTRRNAHQDLRLHVALGVSLAAVKRRAAPEVERVYTRARALCQQVGDTPQLFPVLRGLYLFYLNRGQRRTAQDLAEQLLRQAERQPEVAPRDAGAILTGAGLIPAGALEEAVRHFEQAIAAYNPQEHAANSPTCTASTPASLPAASGRWCCGCLEYPDRALAQSQEAWTLAQEVAHPLSQVLTQVWLACLHQFRQEAQALTTGLRGSIALAAQQGFRPSLWHGPMCRWDGRSRDRGNGPQAWLGYRRGVRPL